MKRALIIEPSGALFGSERALLDLLSAPMKLDYAVCCPPEVPLGAELERRRIRILPYLIADLHKTSRWHRLRAALGLFRACLEYRPDVLYLNQSGCYRIALLAASILNIPIIAHTRIFEDPEYLAKQHPRPHRLRGIIAISKAVEAEIRKFPELDCIPVHRIYDTYLSAPIPQPPPERLVSRIACVGRLVPIKGHNVLVGALAEFKSHTPRIECLIAGDGDKHYIESIKQLALQKNVASSLQWLGFIKDIVPLLRSCSVMVCPSYREPLGRVIFEAWDAGAIPIVYSQSGGAAEMVAAANGGLIYDEQTPECLAKTLQRALALTADERARLIENGRVWMSKNCGSKSYGARIEQTLIADPGARVLTIEASGNLWGSERSLLASLTNVYRLIITVCCPPGKPIVIELKKMGIPLIPNYIEKLHEKPFWYRILAAIGVVRSCLAVRPDILHLNQSGSYRVVLPAAMILNLPILCHVRIFEDAEYLAKQHPRPHRLRGIIAISRAVEAEIRKFPELDCIPVHQIYNAYERRPKKLLAFQEKVTADCRIACIGRLVPIKGHNVLVGALAALKNHEPRIECLIVGDGDKHYIESIKQLALQENVASSLQWLGFIKDIVPLLRSCSVLVCPSYREPLGRVIFEAWDAGAIPIVYSQSGGAAEMVAAANGGLIYDEQTPECLAKTLQRALALTAGERARLIKNGRAWMSMNCDPKRYGESFAALVALSSRAA